MLNVGDDLGRYELIAHLKNGGMATLYLGRRTKPPDNKIFAIKVVHPHYLDDVELVQMFQDEARLSLRIRHPNVVRVEEVGEDQGRHFLAMEYVHGCSVAHLLQALIRRRRRMSPELAVYIAMEVAEGLEAAHEAKSETGELLNVVHRDVSPQNILLAHTGEIRLIDFGIAKARGRMHHSATGSHIRGKLRYMSPEHARGRSVDRRSDLYALGIVLWEMLTMRPLFWAETDFDVLTRVQDPVVEPPSMYAPRISPALDDAVLSALAPDMDARPRTAVEFRTLLSKAVPFAEALDEEQVADLLASVLGDEINRFAMRLPSMVSDGLGYETGTVKTSGGGSKKKTGTDIMGQVLETLTDPNIDPTVVEAQFAPDIPTPEGATELFGAEVAERVQRELGLKDPLGELQEPEDRTEMLSGEALAEIHQVLDRLTRKSGEIETYDASDKTTEPGAAPEPGGEQPPEISAHGVAVSGDSELPFHEPPIEEEEQSDSMPVILGVAAAAIVLAIVAGLLLL